MAPNPQSPMNSAALDAAPLAVVIVVGDESGGALERTIRSLAAHTVLPGAHVCFALPESPAASERETVAKVAALLEGKRHMAVPVSDTHDLTGVLSQVSGLFPGEDIALLTPGVDLPFAWDARLRKAVRAEPRIGAAVPLCDVAPIFSLVEEPARSDSVLDGGLVDRTAYCLGNRSYYEIPRLHAACVYFRREPLEAALANQEPAGSRSVPALDALSRRMRAAGWSCVILDYLYVGYAGSLPAVHSSTDAVEEQAFRQHHPLGGLRRAVNEAIRQGLPPVTTPGLDHRPVQLHIMHFWGGGLDRWVRDFGNADVAAINLLLASYRIGETGGQRLVLYSNPEARVPIRVWDIAQPIRSSASGSIEYRRILDQIVAEFEVEAIIVSSLIGHALDALTQPVRTLVVCHDFYPICQAVNPQFGKTCERCTLEDLRACAKSNPLNRIFVDQPSEDWHAMRGLFVDHILAHRIEMVVPSPSVATTLRNLEPRLQQAPIHVIAHGIDFEVPKLPIPARSSTQPLRIVVLGRLSPQKGTELLRQACEGLRPYAEVTLLGCGQNGVRLAEECGWKHVERYDLAALPDLLKSLAPHAGLLPSVVPETFSYTLSELWALGVPPIASALGSFRDRITDEESGFLFEPDAGALVALVRRLHVRPELLDDMARRLATRPQGRTTAEMVRDYRALLPLSERPIARFRVGIGEQTGLTEPYRHLSEAYAQLSGAYSQSMKAYEDTRTAYERTREELDSLRAVWDQWMSEFAALRVSRRWWLAPKAARLVQELPNRIQAATAEPPGKSGHE